MIVAVPIITPHTFFYFTGLRRTLRSALIHEEQLFSPWMSCFEFISTLYYAIHSNKWSEIRIEQLSRIVYLVLFKCSITTLTFILKIQRWVIISTLELNYYSSKAQLGSWYCMVYRHSSYSMTHTVLLKEILDVKFSISC